MNATNVRDITVMRIGNILWLSIDIMIPTNNIMAVKNTKNEIRNILTHFCVFILGVLSYVLNFIFPPPFCVYYRIFSPKNQLQIGNLRVGIWLRVPITPKACISSATCCGISSMRSIVYHQHVVLYIIKPQEDTRWRVMRYSPAGADDIRRTSCVNDIPSLRLG